MNILVIGKEGRLKKNTDPSIYNKHNIIYTPLSSSDEEIISSASDADVILVDAIGRVSDSVISSLPQLKMIHSEGVGFQGVDTQSAKNHSVYVCNCKGMNASAVAEHTILLMLGMLRDVLNGHHSVHEGNQLQVKENYMLQGNLLELADCTIGLIGFGDIAKCVAKFAHVFGAKVIYYSRTRVSEEIEKEYHVSYVSLDELCSVSDMVSLHVPVTSQTTHMVSSDFLDKMKSTAYLINTSRGELIDSNALIQALKENKIAGAGLDCLENEPVKQDNPLLTVEPEIARKLLLSCHIAGITHSSFVRGYQIFWNNIARIENGEKPINIVNQL